MVNTERARIMLVDDEPLILATYETTLKNIGDLRLMNSAAGTFAGMTREARDSAREKVREAICRADKTSQHPCCLAPGMRRITVECILECERGRRKHAGVVDEFL